MNENSDKPRRPKLGEWRKLTAKAVRVSGGGSGLRRVEKLWERKAFAEPIPAMFIGWRTGNNGTKEWVDEEVGSVFYPDQPVELWLFVSNPRHKPIHVFPADVCFEEIEAQS